jgi:crotonobetainyl-CoA:carnitine CoA-transferase CaiB-like acyl-CoA transferase
MRQYPELFASVNAGKRSVMLDLKDPADRDRALALAAEADVVVEGFRPGVMTRLGLDDAAVHLVNPGCIYCSISGYGQQDDRSQLPGHDVNYQAWAGALSPEGQRATMPVLPVADLASGLAAAFGICAALLGRGAGVAGPVLDVSMTDVLATWTGSASSAHSEETGGGAGSGSREASPTVVPGYGIFTTADGHQVALGVVSEPHFWHALCQELGLHGVASLPFEQRSLQGAALNEQLAEAIGMRRRAGLVTSLMAAGVPVAPVLDRSAMVSERPFPNFPIRFSGGGSGRGSGSGSGRGEDADPRTAVPALNQHAGEGFR